MALTTQPLADNKALDNVRAALDINVPSPERIGSVAAGAGLLLYGVSRKSLPGLLIALVGQLAVIRLAIGSRLTVGEAIGHGARRAPAYFVATIIWILPFLIIGALLFGMVAKDPTNAPPAAAFALLLLACVMLFFAIRMLMTSPVASAEPVGPVAIIKRSWEMTRGNWWRLFAFFLLFVIAVLVAVTAVGAVAGVIAELVLGGDEPLTVGALFVALLTQLVSAAVSVVLMVMLARIYVQLAGDGAAEASVPTSGS